MKITLDEREATEQESINTGTDTPFVSKKYHCKADKKIMDNGVTIKSETGILFFLKVFCISIAASSGVNPMMPGGGTNPMMPGTSMMGGTVTRDTNGQNGGGGSGGGSGLNLCFLCHIVLLYSVL